MEISTEWFSAKLIKGLTVTAVHVCRMVKTFHIEELLINFYKLYVLSRGSHS